MRMAIDKQDTDLSELDTGSGTTDDENGNGQSSDDAETFLTILTPANNSGVLGLGRVTLDGTTLSVDVAAAGLTPEQVHPLHIHGFIDESQERQPVVTDDLDQDGFVETPEAEAQAIGPIIAGLTASGEAQAFLQASTDFPVADANGVVNFSQTYELDPDEPDDAFILDQLSARLEGRFLEFHGLELPPGEGEGSIHEVSGTGGYNPLVPVAGAPLIHLGGVAGAALGSLPSEAFQSLASDALSFLMPYMLRPDGTGPAAPENPDVLAAAEDANAFAALLAPSNNSGVSGIALVEFDEAEGTATVSVWASGLTPDQIHPQHIHGFADDSPSLLPNISLDADLDGFVEDPEGEPVVGPVLLAAIASGEVTNEAVSEDFPVADAEGNLVFTQTYDFNLEEEDDAFIFQELQDRLVGREFQIHGLEVPPGQGEGTVNEVNGTGGYIAELPVANGVFLPLEPELLANLHLNDWLLA
jgi:hypothetical protein